MLVLTPLKLGWFLGSHRNDEFLNLSLNIPSFKKCFSLFTGKSSITHFQVLKEF